MWVQLISYCFFTYQVLRLTGAGYTTIGHQQWDDMMIASRALVLAVTLNGWAISAFRTGLLPSFFSLAILFSGISINRVILFLLVEVRRSAQTDTASSPPPPLQRQHPMAMMMSCSVGCLSASQAMRTYFSVVKSVSELLASGRAGMAHLLPPDHHHDGTDSSSEAQLATEPQQHEEQEELKDERQQQQGGKGGGPRAAGLLQCPWARGGGLLVVVAALAAALGLAAVLLGKVRGGRKGGRSRGGIHLLVAQRAAWSKPPKQGPSQLVNSQPASPALGMVA